MEHTLSPSRYGDPAPQHQQSAHSNSHRQEPELQANSRIQSLRRSVTGLFTFSPRRDAPSQVSDTAPSIPPLDFSAHTMPPPESAHIRPSRSPTPNPAAVPLPATASATPMLFGETTVNTPTAPFSHDLQSDERDPPRRRSLLDKIICPNPNQHNLATLLIHSAEQRQNRAWVKRKRPVVAIRACSTDDVSSPAPLLPQHHTHAHHHRRRLRQRPQHRKPTTARRLKNRTLRALIFGLLLIALLTSYLALALTQDGTAGRPTLPTALHVVFVLLLIFVAVAFLHAFIRCVFRPRRHHRHNHRHRGGRRRHRPRALDLEAAMPAAHAVVEGRRTVGDANALPNGDTTYTPTSPIRVHIINDPLPSGKTPAVAHEPVVVSPTGTVHSLTSPPPVARRGSFPVSPISPRQSPPVTGRRSVGQSAGVSPVRAGHGQEERDGEGQREGEGEVTAPAAPPSYGEWRCSVRADPNLLFWQRVTPRPSPAHTPVEPPQREAQPSSTATSPAPSWRDSVQTSQPQPAPAPNVTAASQIPVVREETVAPTVVTAPPAYSEVLRDRERAARDQMAREDAAGDWPLSAGFGGARMEQGVRVVVEDEVPVAGRQGAEVDGRGSGQSGNADVVGLTRELLRRNDEAVGTVRP